MTAALLHVDAVAAGYGGGDVVHDLTLTVEAGQTLALLGANGAGKSTLLKTVIGLVPARRGRVLFDGADLTAMPAERRARLGLGYVPEGRRVFPGMSVRDNLEVANRQPAGPRRAALERVFALFPALRAKADDHAWRLSGGQQQMLAIGRALMGQPRLLLLDEPSLGLSPRLAGEMFTAVRSIAAAGTAVLLADPLMAHALALADRAVLLRLGRIVAQDRADVIAGRLERDGASLLADHFLR